MGNLSYTFDRLPEREFEIQGHKLMRKRLMWCRSIALLRFVHFLLTKVFLQNKSPESVVWRHPTLRKPSTNGELNDRVDILIKSILKPFYHATSTEAFVHSLH